MLEVQVLELGISFHRDIQIGLEKMVHFFYMKHCPLITSIVFYGPHLPKFVKVLMNQLCGYYRSLFKCVQ